jgi:uncharacterized protein (DUF2147 family)
MEQEHDRGGRITSRAVKDAHAIGIDSVDGGGRQVAICHIGHSVSERAAASIDNSCQAALEQLTRQENRRSLRVVCGTLSRSGAGSWRQHARGAS